jgi:hypothetical protein
MTMDNLHESAAAAEAVVPLAFPFTRAGYRHVLLGRTGRWCLVERTWIGDGRPHLPHYEVVRLQVRAARRMPDGAITPAHEAYPQPSKWGREAWSEPTLARAVARWLRVCPTVELEAWGLSVPSPAQEADTYPAPAPTAGILIGVTDVPLPSPRPDAYLGLTQRPIGTVADYPLGARVQLASGRWVEVVAVGACTATIREPGRGVREVAPGTEVFAVAAGAEAGLQPDRQGRIPDALWRRKEFPA